MLGRPVGTRSTVYHQIPKLAAKRPLVFGSAITAVKVHSNQATGIRGFRRLCCDEQLIRQYDIAFAEAIGMVIQVFGIDRKAIERGVAVLLCQCLQQDLFNLVFRDDVGHSVSGHPGRRGTLCTVCHDWQGAANLTSGSFDE